MALGDENFRGQAPWGDDVVVVDLKLVAPWPLRQLERAAATDELGAQTVDSLPRPRN